MQFCKLIFKSNVGAACKWSSVLFLQQRVDKTICPLNCALHIFSFKKTVSINGTISSAVIN